MHSSATHRFIKISAYSFLCNISLLSSHSTKQKQYKASADRNRFLVEDILKSLKPVCAFKMEAGTRGKGRRTTLPTSSGSTTVPEKLTKELFQEILQGAKTSSLAPENCIPYVKIRKRSESGVRRLMLSYRGEENGDSTLNGVSATGNIPMVVPLVGDQVGYPKSYFVAERGMEDSEAALEVSKFTVWYGIVEGEHRNEALRRLALEAPSEFLSFSWTVLVLQPAPVQILRAFCRNLADKQRARFNVATTLFDSISSLQEDISSMRALSPGKAISVNSLCHYAMGCAKTPSETMRVLAKRALSLSRNVVRELGEILNAEEPEIAYSRVSKTTPPDSLDCRVFRKVIIASTLRNARSFFNSTDFNLESNQICALQRIKEFSRAHDFKTCTGSKLDEMYLGAKKAAREIAKFDSILDGDPWPVQMQTTRINVLQTTMFDAEIALNDGNDTTILPYLADTYKRCCPALANIKISKWKRSLEADNPPSIPASPLNSLGLEHSETDVPVSNGSDDVDDTPSVSESVVNDRERLLELGISIIPKSYSAYARDILPPDSTANIDMVMTEIPPSFPSEETESAISLWKRILKPGSSVFAIVNWRVFQSWYQALEDAEFAVMPHPFVMVPRTEKLHRTRCTSTPQEAALFAVVAFAPGRRVDGFQPDLKTPYTKLSCTHKRKFALIDDVVPPICPLTKKGSRSPLVRAERNVNMLCEIMTTFAPANATVFDPFGGSLTTACACLLTERRCTVLQESEDILAVALPRLVAIAEAGENSRNLRRKEQKDRVRTRAMFDMYNEMTNSAKDSKSPVDSLLEEGGVGAPPESDFDSENMLSPITPSQKRASETAPPLTANTVVCSVTGCIQPNQSSQNASSGSYGHMCATCNSPVHIICCTRVLGIYVEDEDTPLYCSRCYK